MTTTLPIVLPKLKRLEIQDQGMKMVMARGGLGIPISKFLSIYLVMPALETFDLVLSPPPEEDEDSEYYDYTDLLGSFGGTLKVIPTLKRVRVACLEEHGFMHFGPSTKVSLFGGLRW